MAVGQGSWTSQVSGTSAPLTSVYFISSDTGYVIEEGDHLLKTTNGGQNWTQVGPCGATHIYFADNLKGVGASTDVLLNTQDGGLSWDTAYSNSAILGLTGLHFPDNQHGYAIGINYDIDGIVIKTIDGGQTWDTVYTFNGLLGMLKSVFFTDDINGYIADDFGNIHKTTDGGLSWVSYPVDAVTPANINTLFFTSTAVGYAAGDFIYKTTDGGQTWDLQACAGNYFYSVFFTDINQGYAVGGNGLNSMSLYQTDDGGTNWYQGTTGVQTLLRVFFTDTVTGYTVGQNGTILKHQSSSGLTENTQISEGLALYPSPATDRVNLIIAPETLTLPAEVFIYTSQGRLVLQQPINQLNTELNLQNLTSGWYMMQIRDGSQILQKPLVKE